MSRSVLFRLGVSLILLFCLMSPVFFMACDDDDDDDATPTPTPTPTPPPALEYAFVTATDYASGSFYTVTLDSPRTVSTYGTSSSISSDPVCFYSDPYVYVVNRFGFDNIQTFDPENDFGLVAEYSVGTGTNPQEIVVISAEKAYVSQLAAASLLIVNPKNGNQLGTIDMSAYADDDGFPEMAMMHYHAASQSLFVAMQRLDTATYMNVPPNYVVVVNTANDSIKNVIELTGLNPFTDFFYRESNDMLYIGNVGVFTLNDGGIELVNPNSMTAQGYCITEEALGGDIIDFVIFSDTLGYAIISDADFITHVVVFDPSTGTRTSVLLSSAGYDLAGIELNKRDEMWVLDRAYTGPAIHVYNAATQELIETLALSTLPPCWMCFIEN
ncbi:hypothetical protein JXQ70_16190 [bacterium]|nr:hypothetical protein [bacterium]